MKTLYDNDGALDQISGSGDWCLEMLDTWRAVLTVRDGDDEKLIFIEAHEIEFDAVLTLEIENA